MINLKIFELYNSQTHVTQRTAAEGANETLRQLGIDPDEVYVESASGNKVIFNYRNMRYVLKDLGWQYTIV